MLIPSSQIILPSTLISAGAPNVSSKVHDCGRANGYVVLQWLITNRIGSGLIRLDFAGTNKTDANGTPVGFQGINNVTSVSADGARSFSFTRHSTSDLLLRFLRVDASYTSGTSLDLELCVFVPELL